MNLWHLLLVGAGGACGAVIRFGIARWFSFRGKLPIYATLVVNLAGSFAIGLFIGTRLMHEHPAAYALIGTGILGGLTTYSTLNVQKASLAADGNARTLRRYIAATYVGGWLLIAAGIGLGRVVLIST